GATSPRAWRDACSSHSGSCRCVGHWSRNAVVSRSGPAGPDGAIAAGGAAGAWSDLAGDRLSVGSGYSAKRYARRRPIATEPSPPVWRCAAPGASSWHFDTDKLITDKL